MSEFRFACPVCGQHMAADGGASGSQIECPTCFQKIIVPQAPTADSKYVLSATQYIRPQTVHRQTSTRRPPQKLSAPAILAVLIILVGVAGAAILLFHQAISEPDLAWRISVADVPIPESPVAGRIHGHVFKCDDAFLQTNTLTLRFRDESIGDVIVSLRPLADSINHLDGRSFNVAADQTTGPRVSLRWKQANLRTAQIFTNGYAMSVIFGYPGATNFPGKIYLCLPDKSRSWVAGTFNADIRNDWRPRGRIR